MTAPKTTKKRIDGGLDVQLFHSRLEFFIKSWMGAGGPGTEKLRSCGGILLGESSPRGENNALHVFLFGDLLLETLMFITPTAVTMICSPKQAGIIAPLTKPHQDQFVSSVGFNVDVRMIVKIARSNWKKYLLASVEGKWRSFLESQGKEELIDEATIISDEVSVILATKRTQEIAISLNLPMLLQKRTGIACKISRQLMSLMIDQIISLIRSGEEITNQEVGKLIQNENRGGRMRKGLNFGPDFDWKDVRLRCIPVVRSNGAYKFTQSSQLGAMRLGKTGIFL
ncbi:hypothetical protein PtA15_5A265 [Puccinia triticina]|uniref:FACT complex subunit n=1 Tax=Puccinia triticina TaxID=208348 RepID=A0ABY7CL29_9BASI|nr:uncharacterized protein PtA15_5A265 [Puccinia triticina]WAQ84692.1 hypothetical protein PtA15_5A265 [Puccinia triticina]WAR58036.1 hypothetical protein PtB15_5B267 [Puccinia triticina]